MDNKILKHDETSIVKAVEDRINELVGGGKLQIPPDYAVGNALRSAWLQLQQTTDKDGRPVMQVCEKSSIANALLTMSILGLNPTKVQCYFITYGNILKCEPSYLGKIAIAKRVNPEIVGIFAEVVHEGDEFEYEIRIGKKIIVRHIQKPENLKNPIQCVYAYAYDKNEKQICTEIMTFDEIKTAWKKSRVKPVNEDGSLKAGTPHSDFTTEMAKRTVINRLCKHIISTSNDETIIEAYEKTEMTEAEVAVESAKEQLKTPVDVDIPKEQDEEDDF